MLQAIIVCAAALLIVLIFWGGAAWRSYTRGEDVDLSRLNELGNFPYGFPLKVPLWMLRRRRRPADTPDASGTNGDGPPP